MPCRDYYDDHPEQYFRDVTVPALKKQISFAESALCAALNAYEKTLKNFKNDYDDYISLSPLDHIDFEDAGITKAELKEWRTKHQKLDEKHRAEEARKLRESALAKLSPEERKILGVK